MSEEEGNKMKLSIEAATGLQPENNPIFVGLEKNLIQIGYFSVPNFKDANLRGKKIVKLTTIESDKVASQVNIMAPTDVGLPTTGDLTLYLAFQSLVQERHILRSLPVKNPILFTNYELLNRAGITMNSATYEDVREWLLRMKSTTVQFKAMDAKRRGTDAVSVFDRVISASEMLDDGTVADCNHVHLSSWGVENLKSVVPIDLDAYQKLRNQTARILVPHLQVWLFASRTQHVFRKNYSQFCSLLGLAEYPNKSRIIQKLEPAMTELGRYEYIKNWEVSGDRRRGFLVSITHGPKFFRDQKLFFVLKGKQGPTESEPVETNPAINLLPEPRFDANQDRNHKELLARGLKSKDARKIVLTLTAIDIQDRIGFCDYMVKESPGRIKNESGYLFTILRDEEFVLPVEYIKWKALMIERQEQNDKAAADQEKATELGKAVIESFSEYEDFCLSNSTPIDRHFFEMEAEEGREVWQKLLGELEIRLSPHIYQSWFSSLKYLAFSRWEKSVIVMGNPVSVEWVSKYYTQLLDDILKELWFDDHKIEWYSRSSELHLYDLEERSDRELFRIFTYQKNGLSFEEYQEKKKFSN